MVNARDIVARLQLTSFYVDEALVRAVFESRLKP